MSTTTVMLVMVDAGPVRRWWTGPVVGMTRRRGVGRLPARLMYAGWDRRSAVRRKGPLTKYAPGWAWWHRTAGDRSCSGGAPARHGGHDHPQADRWGDRIGLGMLGGHLGPQEPGQLAGDRDGHHLPGVLAGGQATVAAAQPLLRVPRAGDPLGWQAVLASAQLQGGRGAVLVGPGRLDHLGAQVAVATLGHPAPLGAGPAGILPWDQAAEGHELRRARKPAPVGDLAGQGGARASHAPVGGEAGHGIVERFFSVPAGQVGLDGVQGGVPGRPRRSVMRVGRRPGGLVKALGPTATAHGRTSTSSSRPARSGRGATRTTPSR